MADPRVQQARDVEVILDVLTTAVMEFDESGMAVASLRAHQAIPALHRLTSRVAALETALRFVRPEVVNAHLVQGWHDMHVRNGEAHAEDCCICVLDAALAGSGTEPSQEPPAAPCYVCGHPVAEGEGWRRNGKAWCPEHRPVWSHD